LAKSHIILVLDMPPIPKQPCLHETEPSVVELRSVDALPIFDQSDVQSIRKVQIAVKGEDAGMPKF
jgi:hypothetical protein